MSHLLGSPWSALLVISSILSQFLDSVHCHCAISKSGIQFDSFFYENDVFHWAPTFSKLSTSAIYPPSCCTESFSLTMFFVKKLRREILLEPCYLGSKLKEKVKQRIVNELEGQCLGKHGYVISILDVDDAEIFPGLIDNDSGAVSVTVFYSAILLRYHDFPSFPSFPSYFFATIFPLSANTHYVCHCLFLSSSLNN